MIGLWTTWIKHFGSAVLQKLPDWVKAKTKPATSSQLLGTAADLLRSRAELVAENALLLAEKVIRSDFTCGGYHLHLRSFMLMFR